MTVDVIAGAILDVYGGTNFSAEAVTTDAVGERFVAAEGGLGRPDQRLKMFTFSRDWRRFRVRDGHPGTGSKAL